MFAAAVSARVLAAGFALIILLPHIHKDSDTRDWLREGEGTPRTTPAAAGPARSPRPARPDPAPARTPTAPAAPRLQAPQQPRPELSIDNRHDLTCRWHRRLRAHKTARPVRQRNLSRAGRSYSVVPTLSPGTTTPQAPPVMAAPLDA